MSTALPQPGSPVPSPLAASDAARPALLDDGFELGCESACPWLQVEGWEPLDAHRAPALGAGY